MIARKQQVAANAARQAADLKEQADPKEQADGPEGALPMDKGEIDG